MPNAFENTVADFIEKHSLLASRANILLAVSGGADSVAIAFALKRIIQNRSLNVDLKIAHINHNLRGDSSDADEQFVIDFGKELSLDVVTRSIDVRAFAAKEKLSIETAARILRLNTLAQIARRANCHAVATAHHADDNAETLIHRLLRGTGFRGLAGIPPEKTLACKAGKTVFIRPLLCVTRRQIVEYCRTNSLTWRHDHTNDDYAYTRNRIRHLLLPQLQHSCRQPLAEQLLNLSQSAQKLAARITAEADTQWPKVVKQTDTDRIVLDKMIFSRLPEIVAVEIARRALTAIGCGERNLTEYHYKNILRLSKAAHPTEISLPAGYGASVNRKSIVFAKARSRQEPPPIIESQTLNIPGTTICAGCTIEATVINAADCDIEEFKAQKDKSIEWLDYDKIAPPLIVRKRRPGDRFHPFGMACEKKIGKFLTAARIDPELRRQLLVIADTEKIVWLAPIRPSEKTRLTEQTKRILQIQIKT